MGVVDYMILSERFQGIRRECIRPSLVDAAILIKSVAPIALFYLFNIWPLIVLRYPIFIALFLCFYLKREEELLSVLYGEPSARRPRCPMSR